MIRTEVFRDDFSISKRKPKNCYLSDHSHEYYIILSPFKEINNDGFGEVIRQDRGIKLNLLFFSVEVFSLTQILKIQLTIYKRLA
jgi:hypothetical protein